MSLLSVSRLLRVVLLVLRGGHNRSSVDGLLSFAKVLKERLQHLEFIQAEGLREAPSSLPPGKTKRSALSAQLVLLVRSTNRN